MKNNTIYSIYIIYFNITQNWLNIFERCFSLYLYGNLNSIRKIRNTAE